MQPHVKHGLGSTLVPGAAVVMDSWPAHKATGRQQALARSGALLLDMPPDSPDLSPMERCAAKLKTALRAAKAQTREALDNAIQKARETLTAFNARNCFNHCGYAIQ